MPTVKLSDVAHEALQAYKENREHTSFDSAVRELLYRCQGPIVERGSYQYDLAKREARRRDGGQCVVCGGCGTEEFNIKFELDLDGDIWAECAQCGRGTRALDTVSTPLVRPSSDRRDALQQSSCAYCGDEIDGDVMVPEGEGPMHAECWVEWMGEQG